MATIEKEEKERLLSHFSEKVSEELVSYVTDVALVHSRYLFIKTVAAGIQQCYCTHCAQSFHNHSEQMFRHNEIRACEKCESRCAVKQAGRGRKRLIDTAYVEWFEKSIVDPTVLVARGLYVQRDYSGDFRKVETYYSSSTRYVFESGKATMLLSRYASYCAKEFITKRSTVYSAAKSLRVACFISLENVKSAVEGTPLQYSTWEEYKDYDLLSFFGFAAKNPSVELVTKFGMKSVVKARLLGNPTLSTINWRAKTIEGLFKLQKHEIREIRDSMHDWHPEWLYILQQLRKEKSKWKVSEFTIICAQLGIDMRMTEVNYLKKHMPLQKLFNYAIKQAKKRSGYYEGYVLVEWLDYLNACKKLEMDICDESVLFPQDLHEAHQRTLSRVKIKEDEALNFKIKKRFNELNKLSFEFGDLFMRPMASSTEIVSEGNELKHCIGNYAKSYANGHTDLFVIRQKNKPSMPFYSVEINYKQKTVRQVRGFKNAGATDEVTEFMVAFEAAKLKTSKARKVV